jgi:tetratricopeptide (TPR) repeat protein
VVGIVLAAAVAGVALSGVLQTRGADACGDPIECRDLALQALAGQQGETAIAHLDSALSRAPETEHPLYAELWCLRAQADQSLGRVPDAMADYGKCIEWTQGDPGLAELRGLAEKALADLGAGAAVTCGTPDECRALAEGLIGEGRLEEAVAALDQGIAKVPEDQHPPNARLWCLRGDAHAARQSTDEAVSSYRTCIGWTEGDPGLEALRQETEAKIQALSGG